jgi:predicted Kef-type K+ transport protein
VSDRNVFQLGVVTVALGVAMIAVPWLGTAATLGALAAVAVPTGLVATRRLSTSATSTSTSPAHASSRA